jgi:hypothetical protein
MLQQHSRSNARADVTRQCWFCVLFGLMLFLCGCASGTTRKTSSVQSAKTVEASVAELSSRNQSLLGHYSAEVEAAADKIIFESPSAATRRQALVWKADAIPVLQNSLLRTDPVAAVLDTWVFIFQMTAYMEQPVVKQGLGEFYSVVAETLKSMDAEMEQLVRAAAPSADVADLRRRLGAWAEAHPIQAGVAGRQSVDPELIRQAGQADLGAIASIRALAEGLGDLTARLDAYNIYASKQARWQAELLLSDLTRDPQIGAAMSNFADLSNTLKKASSSMDRMPELLGQAREAVLADVVSQRLAVQSFLREERLQTLDVLQQERIATVAALRGERLAATADLRRERQIVLDALHNDQVAVMNEVRAISEQALKDFDGKARGLIDHFFLRAFELVLLTLLLCSLAAWLLLRRFASWRRDRGEKLYDRAA